MQFHIPSWYPLAALWIEPLTLEQRVLGYGAMYGLFPAPPILDGSTRALDMQIGAWALRLFGDDYY